MNNELWGKIEAIVDEALDKPEAERKAFIKNRCKGNPALQKEALDLLGYITVSEGWLEDSGDYQHAVFSNLSKDLNKLSHTDTLIGKQVGAYTLTEELAKGGMGTVYLAKRTDDDFDHIVAIKIINRENITPDNLQRFNQEQKILAKLSHPGIAQLYDGGVTANGYPYIIMEYVNGVPITEYCDQNNFGIQQRVQLFKQVLKAVRYAHENLIIHRDLKPDNILIDETGRVKILDFGISKLLDDEENLLLTKTGSKVLTPRYAAPEQIKQENITTATDMYSLGVILYRMLTGTGPIDFEDLTQYQVEQAIISVPPQKPSSCVSDPKIQKKLTGDLDAILLKSIRKEPESRYRFVNDLLNDLQNYENGHPVSAQQDSFKYRSKKFIRRHKRGFLIAVSILLLISAMTAFYTWRITQERNQAQLEAEKAEAITTFLIELFEANDPNVSQGDNLTARELLEIGENRINNLNDQPVLKGRITEVLGNLYGLLSYADKADSLNKISLSIKRNLYESSDPELGSIYYSLASSKNMLGDYDSSITFLDTAITYQRKSHGNSSKEVGKSLELLAESLRKNGKIDSAYQVIQKSRAIFENIGDTLSKAYLKTLMEFGSISNEQGNFPEAETIFRSSLALSNKLYDPPHPQILNNINGLASTLKELEKFSLAESLYSESIQMTKELYSKMHINTAVTMNDLSGLYYYTSEFKKSDSLYNESYQILKEVLGAEHPYTVSVVYNWANLKSNMEDYEEAEQLYKQVIKLDIAKFGEVHQNVASDYTGLASLYRKQENYDDAITYFNKSLQIRKQVYENTDHPYIAYNERSLARIMTKLEKYEEAELRYKSALSSLSKVYGSENGNVKQTAKEYAHLLQTLNRPVNPDSLIQTYIKK